MKLRNFFAAIALVAAGLGTAPDAAYAQAAAADDRRALMLLPGHYDDVGSWEFDLATAPPDGWVMLDKARRETVLSRAQVDLDGRPMFLARGDDLAHLPAIAQQPGGEQFYLRIPGVGLRAGTIDEVPLKRRELTPQLDHRYELKQGALPFALTVHNGLRARNGTPYGEGAHYVIDIADARYEYFLPGFGWESTIRFAGDIDGDGRPDFVVDVAGNNSWTVYLLLSSRARPGMNEPVASLRGIGC